MREKSGNALRRGALHLDESRLIFLTSLYERMPPESDCILFKAPVKIDIYLNGRHVKKMSNFHRLFVFA